MCNINVVLYKYSYISRYDVISRSRIHNTNYQSVGHMVNRLSRIANEKRFVCGWCWVVKVGCVDSNLNSTVVALMMMGVWSLCDVCALGTSVSVILDWIVWADPFVD